MSGLAALMFLWIVPGIAAVFLNTLVTFWSIRQDVKRRKQLGDKYVPSYDYQDLILGFLISACPILCWIAFFGIIYWIWKQIGFDQMAVVKPRKPK